jgi:HK97 family phage prohead protease
MARQDDPAIHPNTPELDRIYTERAKSQEKRAKESEKKLADRPKEFEKAKATFDRDMNRAKSLEGIARREVESKILQRYNKKIEELTGVAAYRKAADDRYKKAHGHLPDEAYTRHEFDSTPLGGIGSAVQGIREYLRDQAAPAAEVASGRPPTALDSPSPRISNTDLPLDSNQIHEALRGMATEAVAATAMGSQIRSIFDRATARSSSSQLNERKAVIAPGKVEHKSFKATVVATGSPGELVAFAAVTGNLDRGSDVIQVGAFERVVAKFKTGELDLPPLLFGHNTEDIRQYLGSIKQIDEVRPGDSRLSDRLFQKGYGALRVVGKLNLDTESGRAAWALVQAGDLKTLSFMYTVAPGGSEIVQAKGESYRLLKEIDEVFEVSLLPVPMNSEARVAGLKSLDNGLRIDRIQAAVEAKLASILRAR